MAKIGGSRMFPGSPQYAYYTPLRQGAAGICRLVILSDARSVGKDYNVEIGTGATVMDRDKGTTTMFHASMHDAPEPPRRVDFSYDEVQRAAGTDKLRVRAIDDQGVIMMMDVQLPKPSPPVKQPQPKK